MSTYYSLIKKIPASDVFDGRLEEFGIRELIVPDQTTDTYRCLTDGRGYVWVTMDGAGFFWRVRVQAKFCSPWPMYLKPTSYPSTKANFGALIRTRSGKDGRRRRPERAIRSSKNNPFLKQLLHCGQVGRERFARHPGASWRDWVSFRDLPEATRNALWQRDGRKLVFPYGLNLEDDVINRPSVQKKNA